VGDHMIHFGYLDFPGGWLTDRTEDREEAWESCLTWFRESQVLIVPLDSAVLMEGTLRKHRRAAPSILAVSQVEQVAMEWAKTRSNEGDGPALLVLAPVKCEAYFNDNGGRFDKSEDLLTAVMQSYRSVIEAVKAEFGRGSTQLQILYAPVDTYGCVEFIKPYWHEVDIPGGFEFSADYRIREPGRISIKGAADIMAAICRNVLGEKVQLLEAYRAMVERDRVALDAVQTNRNLWQRFVELVTGAGRRRAKRIRGHFAELGKAGEALAQIDEAIDRMAARSLESRARRL